ncbi:uncharacterized protein LOC122068247 [Macadamia integrifolia]|uniref:uncharacterized protein LOC122068247 n=1 Tax=Macadamia integrifolia TaxID=60698 RepID=UPI001C4EF957|nr:uncharacterized protein LOC122068247 [Macadamia integrifolia]
MADSTHFRRLDDAVKHFDETVATQSERLDRLQAVITDQQQSFADLALRFAAMDGRLEQALRPPNAPPEVRRSGSSTPIDSGSSLPAPANLIQGRTIRLDFPRFDGVDPSGWIFKAERFFDCHGTSDNQRLLVASFHMDGQALQRFQWMYRSSQFSTWAVFTRALELYFGPSEFDDPQATLVKLTQTTTVAEYQSRFETLANRIEGIPPSFLVSCFISGLRGDIRNELARPALPPTTQPTSTVLTLPAPPSRIPIKRLTPTEMQQRREKGLCYNCDDKYAPGHRCKTRQLFLLEYEDGDEQVEPPDGTASEDLEQASTPETATTGELSYHSLVGTQLPTTLRLTGYIDRKPIQVLADGGSTHNFIQSRVAKHLGLAVETAPNITVMVGSGSRLKCEGLVRQLQVKLVNHPIKIDAFILPLFGADMVLGVQWLAQLGPMLFDYSKMTLEFHDEGRRVTLVGDASQGPMELQYHNVRRVLNTGAVAALYQLELQAMEQDRDGDSNMEIKSLLRTYERVFAKPPGLPPSRPQDHAIHLQSGTSPVNVRPYRYPHFQKTEIEHLVIEMLTAGIIRPSTSAFSSLVLLVKKKDGSWRFCVDYRALNAITIRDRFPIPTVDELLDELHGPIISLNWISVRVITRYEYESRMYTKRHSAHMTVIMSSL